MIIHNNESFAKDVEKATDPLMKRAQTVKDEVNVATAELFAKQNKNSNGK